MSPSLLNCGWVFFLHHDGTLRSFHFWSLNRRVHTIEQVSYLTSSRWSPYFERFFLWAVLTLYSLILHGNTIQFHLAEQSYFFLLTLFVICIRVQAWSTGKMGRKVKPNWLSFLHQTVLFFFVVVLFWCVCPSCFAKMKIYLFTPTVFLIETEKYDSAPLLLLLQSQFWQRKSIDSTSESQTLQMWDLQSQDDDRISVAQTHVSNP